MLEEEILDHVGHWYAPVELFHRITEIDQARRKAGKAGLLDSVKYVPSSRRKLYHKLKLLTDEEMDAVNQFVDSDPDSLDVLVDSFPEARRTLLLDGLLAYQQYRIVVDRPDSTHVAWRKKDKILLARCC